MRKIRLAIAMVFVSIAVLVACNPFNSSSGEVVLTEADNGRTVEVSVGTTIKIVLPCNSAEPNRMYSSITSTLPGKVEILDQQGDVTYQPGTPEGTCGTETYTYKVVAVGSDYSTYNYSCEWWTDNPTVYDVVITIIAK